MKKFLLVLNIIFLIVLTNVEMNSQIIWDGPTISFIKPDFADFNSAMYQDRITDDIWITRRDNQSIFNIAEEDYREWETSPQDTRWALGSIADGIENLEFNTWVNTVDWTPPSVVGQNMVLFLVTDNIYIDIKFTSWTSGQDTGGGGFSYERSTGDVSESLWTGPTITFSKADYADWTLPENQDRITDNVWLTRADVQGIFNIAIEEQFSFGWFGTRPTGSPIDTRWAFGSISEGVENLDFDSWVNTIFYSPLDMVGEDMVLYLVTDNIYIDIKFTSWTSGQGTGGGGFSYERSTGNVSQTFWLGPPKTVTKPDSADWTLQENQDRITDNVWITRAHQQGIFNAAQEEFFVDSYVSSPTQTLWAFGTTGDGVENLDFNYFLHTVEFEPPSVVNEDMVLYLVPHDIYLDIKFTSWSVGGEGGGGGFAYIRSTGTVPAAVDLKQRDMGAMIYPNPARDFVRVIRPGFASRAVFSLYDPFGRQVMSVLVDETAEISLKELSKGLYLYRLQEGETIHSGTLLVE